MSVKSVTILGSTGSIGSNTLDVIARHPQHYCVHALSASTNVDMLLEQCRRFTPDYAVMYDSNCAQQLRHLLNGEKTQVLEGMEGLEYIASHEGSDTVMAAIVGGVGLAPTYAAVKSGKKVLLANKEALVMAGSLFMQAVAESGATLLPIDSEHNAMFQCLPVNDNGRFDNAPGQGFRKIVLTGSGGPFLHTSPADFPDVTPDQACAHPNWIMGRKISVDSATMVNKALELIEACFLFGLDQSAVEIMVHPQSIIHSMVYYRDGSVLAQMGNPDMRTPISYGLAWPDRIDAGVAELDLLEAARLDFLPPDSEKFPCLSLGRAAAAERKSAPVILNAANEVAVEAFLAGNLGFDQIPVIIDSALQAQPVVPLGDLDEVLAEDGKTRLLAKGLIKKLKG